MISKPKLIGAFIKWIIKGCKTKFSDEYSGIYKGYFFEAEFENWLLGMLVCLAVIQIAICII